MLSRSRALVKDLEGNQPRYRAGLQELRNTQWRSEAHARAAKSFDVEIVRIPAVSSRSFSVVIATLAYVFHTLVYIGT